MSSHSLPVVVTAEARDDLRAIYLHGERTWGEAAADRYHSTIERLLDRLGRFPLRGRSEYVRSEEVRVIGVGSHRVFYQVRNESVTVLRVTHEKMGTVSLFES